MNNYFDDLETRSADERNAAQFQHLRDQVEFAQNHTQAYREKLSGIDVAQLVDFAALARLPLTRKSDLISLQEGQKPFGGLAAKLSGECRRVFASPGPIYEPDDHTADYWRLARALYAAGFRTNDLVYNTFSYHFTPAGSMLESGASAIGCGVVAAGPGQTDLQIQTINDLQPNAYVGTPSFLNILLEKSSEQGTPIACFNKALVSGEALPPSLRDSIRGQGIDVYQCYATADVGLIAYESPALNGLIIDEGVLVEIVRPGTGDPVTEGEVGEVVVTPLSNRCYPLIRFATGDLSAFVESTSSCGRTNRCIKGWMGRGDQTTKVRGMFVHPEQVDKVVKQFPEIIRARLLVERVNNNDEMTLRCECESADPALKDSVTEALRAVCKLRGNVQFVSPGTLENDGKVIDDSRPVE